jgi:hypothetical protein
MRIINESFLDRFFAIYPTNLERAILKYPAKYSYPVHEVPIVSARMRYAFKAGTYNHDGFAIRWTCKALGIGHTRKAIEAFITQQ